MKIIRQRSFTLEELQANPTKIDIPGPYIVVRGVVFSLKGAPNFLKNFLGRYIDNTQMLAQRWAYATGFIVFCFLFFCFFGFFGVVFI